MSKCLMAGMRVECVEAGMARKRTGKPKQTTVRWDNIVIHILLSLDFRGFTYRGITEQIL
jgi:hypothetical protein